MEKVFPKLKNVAVEMVWSGYVGITVNRITHFGRVDNNTYFVQGFSGHGVALTSLAGKIMADGDAPRKNQMRDLSATLLRASLTKEQKNFLATAFNALVISEIS